MPGTEAQRFIQTKTRTIEAAIQKKRVRQRERKSKRYSDTYDSSSSREKAIYKRGNQAGETARQEPGMNEGGKAEDQRQALAYASAVGVPSPSVRQTVPCLALLK